MTNTPEWQGVTQEMYIFPTLDDLRKEADTWIIQYESRVEVLTEWPEDFKPTEDVIFISAFSEGKHVYLGDMKRYNEQPND